MFDELCSNHEQDVKNYNVLEDRFIDLDKDRYVE